MDPVVISAVVSGLTTLAQAYPGVVAAIFDERTDEEAIELARQRVQLRLLPDWTADDARALERIRAATRAHMAAEQALVERLERERAEG